MNRSIFDNSVVITYNMKLEGASVDPEPEYRTSTHFRKNIISDTFLKLMDDVIYVIAEFMDIDTYSVFRHVYRVPWKANHVKEYGYNKMVRIHDRYSHFPVYGNTLSFQNIEYTTKCVQCQHSAITFIEWECGTKRRCIPWCVTHVPSHLMDNVECFCISGE